jgi:CPA2 family monovalent cation:H+ antiporter-2
MFGAIFFVSVGMMVDPDMIVKYWLPILIIFFVTVIGQPIFGTIGMLISGQNLKNSVLGGFSFAQIGEFSFIIASLGVSLGILDGFMYPIAVAVSVITILTTPVYIKNAPKIAGFIDRKLPERLKSKLSRMTSGKQDEEEKSTEWIDYLKDYFLRFVIFGGIMAVTTLVSLRKLYPNLADVVGVRGAKLIIVLLVYAVIALFLRPLINPNSNEFTALWLKNFNFRLPLLALSGIKIAFTAVFFVSR